ncbi:molybdopterin-dependent oxidoreductase, partial [Acidobacteriota bacterium]
MKKVRFSRRRFMKTGLACLAGTAVSGEALFSLATKDSGNSVSRTSLKSLRAFPTLCGMCQAGCGVLAYLDGDRCVQILGNPDHPVNHGRICAKGIAGLNLVNDPERLLFPMRRIGERGGNNWTRITWDEAYQMIIPGISRKKDAGPVRNVVWDLGKEDPLFLRFIEGLEGSITINRSRLRDLNLKTAFQMTTGDPELIPDIARSRTILNFGANPYAHHDLFLGLASRLVEARLDHGSKLYTFD